MDLGEREAARIFHTYKRLPLEIDHGEGMYLFARDGTRYLDMFAGIAVNALGYGHPAILRAIEEQARKYIHLSNYFLQEPQIALAEMLLDASGFARVFFGNSGTEAIEGALKIARKWGADRGKQEVFALSNAFHGRTMGALSVMDRPKYREGFEPFLPHCGVVEFNDVAALHKSVTTRTAAVIVEFIQGEGGIRPVSTAFVDALRYLQESFGFLLIADEIQSGIGRTGKFFAYQHFDIRPDIVVVAKPIGGGLPLGAILGSAAIADVLAPGVHGTTFGGNPVACAAGAAVLREVRNGLMQNAETMGALLRSRLLDIARSFPAIVRDVRGKGLMLGMELDREGDQIVTAMRDRKILINCTERTVLRFVPPLIIREAHIEETAGTLKEVLGSLH